MSGVIERVAGRLWEVMACEPGMPRFAHEQEWSGEWPAEYLWLRDLVRAQARTAILAMREPTDAMVLAACHAGNADMEASWQAAIDEALK